MRRGTVFLFAACLACGPLDRRDGALIIELVGAPAEVDSIDVTVRAGGRSFQERVPRPADDRITYFSAVPIGPAELDLVLLAGGRAVISRVGLKVTILENEAVSLSIDLVDRPEFTIVEPAAGAHPLRGGPTIPVYIEVETELPIELSARANTAELELSGSSPYFTGEIDPALAGEILPAEILLEVTACLVGVAAECVMQTRAIEVTRAAWRTTVAEGTTSRPVPLGDRIVLVDAEGKLRVISSSSGEDLFGIELGAEVREDVAIGGSTVYVTARDGRMFAVELGAEVMQESIELGATSAPVSGLPGVIVAADRELIEVEERRTVATLPRRVRAPPLVDEEGIVAADILGNVLALDPGEATLFSANVGASVFAQPVRYRGRIVIGTSTGELVQLDANGEEAVPRIALGRPIVHAPVVIGDRLIAAADDRVFFIDGDQVVAGTEAGGTITGAPVAWIDGGAIVGVQNGLVRAVSERGSRTVERVAGAAFGPLVITTLGEGRGAGIAVVGSGGDLAMLEPEEGF